MSDELKATQPQSSSRIPVDMWAVVLALALVALVRLGWLPGIGW
jgi:hypothetical protein